MRYHIDTIPVWDALKQQASARCARCAAASRRPMWIGFWAAR